MASTVQSKILSHPQEAEIASLLELSARVGNDPLLAQASNGNTSIKIGGVLWIKASGKWLAKAKQEEILVPLVLAQVEESMRTGAEILQVPTLKNDLSPSIETAMHAVLHHRVVVHVHSVNAIAWAVRQDAPLQLAKRLAGLRWQFIPYVPSGVALAREIEKHLSRSPETDVLILGNHGLVVCGDDCEAAENLLTEVERRIAVAPRKSPQSEIALLTLVSQSSQWRLPDFDASHALGTDVISQRILKGGILYPCQAIFLGTKIRTLPPSVPLSRFAEYANGRDGAQSFVIIEGCGVIINKTLSSAERATLTGLRDVLQRTEESAPLRYLAPSELTVVLKDDKQGYRKSLEVDESETLEVHPCAEHVFVHGQSTCNDDGSGISTPSSSSESD